MNKCIYYYLSVALLGVWQSLADVTQTNDWGPATNSLQMSIRIEGDKAQIKVGQPVKLLIRYKNVSTNETFTLYEFEGVVDDASYSFIIRSPSGMYLTSDYKVQEPASGAVHGLGPGEIFETRFDIGKLYKFDQVGTYRIIAKKAEMWSPSKHQAFIVVSNPLDVKFVPSQ
jgi:hypothetical protein